MHSVWFTEKQKKEKNQNTNFIVDDRYIATLGEIKMLIPMAEIIVGVVHFKKKT